MSAAASQPVIAVEDVPSPLSPMQATMVQQLVGHFMQGPSATALLCLSVSSDDRPQGLTLSNTGNPFMVASLTAAILGTTLDLVLKMGAPGQSIVLIGPLERAIAEINQAMRDAGAAPVSTVQ